MTILEVLYFIYFTLFLFNDAASYLVYADNILCA